MSAKMITGPLTNVFETSPAVRKIRGAIRSLARRFSRAAASTDRVLAVEARVSIGAKKSLVVVRCHGQRFLIAMAGDTFGPLIEVKPASMRRARREREV